MKKRLIEFDLDQTLAESKATVQPNMIDALKRLLDKVYVVIISGGDYEQMEKQLVNQFENSEEINFNNLHLLPTSGTKYYTVNQDGSLNLEYSETFSDEQADKIMSALNSTIKKFGWYEFEQHGERIENRGGSQVTYSVFGQKAPLEVKEPFDPDHSKRLPFSTEVQEILGKDFAVRIGGSTSVDITLEGRDKAYGTKKIAEILKVSLDEIFFVGDALNEGGNDYPVKALGVDSKQTSGPKETLEIIEKFLQNYE